MAGSRAHGYVPLEGPSTSYSEGPISAALGGPESASGRRAERIIADARQGLLTHFRNGPNIQKQQLGPGGQQPQHVRQKDKFVPLPDAGSMGVLDEEQQLLPEDFLSESEVERVSQNGGASFSEEAQQRHKQQYRPGGQSFLQNSMRREAATSGRITSYCISEGLDRKKLDSVLSFNYKPQAIHTYEDVVHLHIETPEVAHADIFFFEYGVIICWGLDEDQEGEVVQKIGRVCQRGPYEEDEVEIDEFQFNCSTNEPPHIQNDTITINKRQASDHRARLAISHALAQSTKLCVYEERVVDLVEETKHLPVMLAEKGRADISTKKVAQLIGKVFLQSSTVNLLSSVLDTPEFFWSAPDSLQAFYERACEYLELKTRVDVLNARFQVLQEMLDMLRDQQNNFHASRLEMIIIILLMVDVVLMLFQLMSLVGIIGPSYRRR